MSCSALMSSATAERSALAFACGRPMRGKSVLSAVSTIGMGRITPLTKVNDEGVWTIVVPENLEGHLYKYEIITPDGRVLLKADPYAFYSELRPHTASIVYDLKGYEWNDSPWQRKKRRKRIYDQPMVIYELHFGSWKKKQDGRFYTYREMADELIPYVLERGFTHIELLPLVEHPLDRSSGISRDRLVIR
ncbi:hypothetical protein DI43_15610 [Geobacillus sp. CAMR12739]|nr:hypothetical protein DI43_15610 [Geobacillus sp. CAMR12739]